MKTRVLYFLGLILLTVSNSLLAQGTAFTYQGQLHSGAFRTHFKPKTENIFVYGREVKDFRTVDYDAIAMLNVSATQELARKVDALQTQLDQTVAEKAALQKKLAALAARDQAREARLARLESSLEQISARGTYASLKH